MIDKYDNLMGEEHIAHTTAQDNRKSQPYYFTTQKRIRKTSKHY